MWILHEDLNVMSTKYDGKNKKIVGDVKSIKLNVIIFFYNIIITNSAYYIEGSYHAFHSEDPTRHFY